MSSYTTHLLKLMLLITLTKINVDVAAVRAWARENGWQLNAKNWDCGLEKWVAIEC